MHRVEGARDDAQARADLAAEYPAAAGLQRSGAGARGHGLRGGRLGAVRPHDAQERLRLAVQAWARRGSGRAEIAKGPEALAECRWWPNWLPTAFDIQTVAEPQHYKT